ncbi:microcephalin [Elgaria multicarinata webbii]|uniref:microcephalin n=1 Tax=Elgaria multicarinata webbii TaxID=159646 RepID=UPI002FCCF53E
MGATVSKTFNKQVTHVIFKEGLSSTWNKAQKLGVKLVSVLWVEKCREVGAHVNESLYPAVNTNEGLPQLNKKHKCMQPKNFIEKTPENDRRLQKRLEIMVKELAQQKAATGTDIPVLLFEDDGSLMYSPASKIKYQCSAMERRMKDMKEKRENLSLTASQMSQMSDSSSVPAVHEQILISTTSTCTSPSERKSSDSVNSSFANMLGNSETKNLGKKSTKYIPEVESAADVSLSALWSSPVSSRDSKLTSPKQPSAKRFKKTLILSNSLEDGFPATKAKSKTSTQKHGNRNDCSTTVTGNHLSETSDLKYKVSSETIHLEVAEDTSDNHLNLETNLPSVNCTLSPTGHYSTWKQQKKPRRRSSLGLSTSALCEINSQNDFLQAMLSPVQSTKDQDSSFEDYFSPSNLNKNKIRVSLPFPCQQKSQNPNEMVCKYSSLRSKPEAMLQGSNKIGAIYSQKRKRETEINENAVSSDCMQSIPLQSEESAALNYMSKTEKQDKVETTDCLLNLNIQEKICTTSVNNYSPKTGADKFSLGDAKDGSCKPLCDQMDEPGGKLKSTGRIKKPLRTLVMTSMTSEKQNAVVQVVRKLGGFLFSDEVCETTSHVVAGTPRRTLNVLMGIARGCWIVCYEWVLWSLECGHWISEEPYELSVDFPAAPICRLQRYFPNGKGHLKLFSDQPIMFISCSSQPPCEKLCELVQLCGGKVCKTLRQAEICIGECRVGKYVDKKCLSEKWILDSITHHKIHPPESYIFQNKVLHT